MAERDEYYRDRQERLDYYTRQRRFWLRLSALFIALALVNFGLAVLFLFQR